MSEVGPLTPEELAALDPGIRSTVAWLRFHGFDTVDSGDGVTKYADAPDEASADVADVGPGWIGCALPVPNVAIQVEPDQLVAEADRLAALLLSEHGVTVDPQGENLVADQAVISASYDPANRTALILLTGFVAPEVA